MSDDEQKFEYTQAALPEQQKPVCPPETVLPIPDELRENAEASQRTVPLIKPRKLRIWSHEQQVACEEGTYGDVVIIEEGSYEEEASIDFVLSITNEVLNFIAKKKLEKKIELNWHRNKLTAAWLHNTTGMTVEQGNNLIEYLTTIQNKVNDLALSAAETALTCVYKNANEHTATCESEDALRDEEHPEAHYSYTVAAGAVISHTSQEDAEQKAQELAESMLVCIYGNKEFEARCEERPNRPMEIMDPVPNDTVPIYPGRELRLGSVTVPANMFISYATQSEADEIAQNYGYSLLVCWYPNFEVKADCEYEEARGYGLDPLETEAVQADPETKTPGQHVHVPEGFFISEISYEDATQRAEMLAQSLIECFYINDEYEVHCDADAATLNGELIYLSPQLDKGVPSINVPRGTFISPISPDDANELARQSTEGMLQCVYCNIRIMPTCVPDWIIEGVLDPDPKERIPLPLPQGLISYKGNVTNAKLLPPEATIGVEAETCCGSTAREAMSTCSAMARVPVSGTTESCVYFNDEVVVACNAEDPYNHELERPLEMERRVKPTGEPYYFSSLYNVYDPVAAPSTPAPYEYIIIPAGLFSGAGDISIKESLNEKAIQFGRQSVKCYFSNPVVRGHCEEETNTKGLGSAVTWTVGRGKTEYPEQITKWSNHDNNPIIFPENSFFVQGKGDDLSLINEQLAELVIPVVKNMILCVYTNTVKISVCTEMESHTGSDPECQEIAEKQDWYQNPSNIGYVPANVVFADTPNEAEIIAKQLADSLAACDTDTIVTYECGGPCPSSSSSSSSSSSPGEPPHPDDSSSSSSDGTITPPDGEDSSSSSSSSSESSDSSSSSDTTTEVETPIPQPPQGGGPCPWHCPYFSSDPAPQSINLRTAPQIPIETLDNLNNTYNRLNDVVLELTKELEKLENEIL